MNSFFETAADFFDTYSANILATATAFVLVAAMILLAIRMGDWIGRKIERKDTADTQRKRLLLYGRVAIRILILYVVVAALIFMIKLWVPEFYKDIIPNTRRIAGFVTRQLCVAALFLAIWEGCYYFLRDRLVKRGVSAKQRMMTLFPIAINVLTIVMALLYGFVLLSAIGVDIAPLLTGAGVAGIAVGLAAQQSIRDLISGFTIIIEDLIQIGDVVKLGDYGGQVERITLRKVQLRDYDGSVYTVPNSEIKVISNMTKEFSFAVFNISVAYTTDVTQAIAVIQKAYDDMKADEAFAPLMLAPIEIPGVDQLGDSAIVIKARIKTPPIRQWDVSREFNRRIKLLFEESGIEIPFPQRVVHVAPDNPPVVAAHPD